ncbi:MAG: winged helix-turn-helix transcriptional regulator [Rhodospirillaceae bacterium]|nr:winged helix-turn-helix transcriptional regulator [Rhodospirillaceae bacterium]
MSDILINVSQLAKRLGVSRSTVYDRMKRCEQTSWNVALLPQPATTDGAYCWSLREVDAWLETKPLKRAV